MWRRRDPIRRRRCCLPSAFLFQFVVGGLSGITFAVVPLDWQMKDSYYLVAHFHFVLFGGTSSRFWRASHYWFPKMSGRMLSERLGKGEFLAHGDRLQHDFLRPAFPRLAWA